MEAIDGIAVENPLIYVYEIDESEQPKYLNLMILLISLFLKMIHYQDCQDRTLRSQI